MHKSCFLTSIIMSTFTTDPTMHSKINLKVQDDLQQPRPKETRDVADKQWKTDASLLIHSPSTIPNNALYRDQAASTVAIIPDATAFSSIRRRSAELHFVQRQPWLSSFEHRQRPCWQSCFPCGPWFAWPWSRKLARHWWRSWQRSLGKE